MDNVAELLRAHLKYLSPKLTYIARTQVVRIHIIYAYDKCQVVDFSLWGSIGS